MKKLALAVSFVILFANLQAQEVITWEGLKKQKEKTDKKIENPKKNIKYKTWVERGNTYFTISTFNTTGLYEGMPATGGLNSAEFLLVEKPTSKMARGNEEIWVYPHKELTFVGGTLKSWKETDFIDKKSIVKSAKAYLKAIELDKKGKFKKKRSSMDQFAQVRGVLINKGVDFYSAEDYTNAYDYLQWAKKMGELPRAENDTLYDPNMIEYYCGIIGKDGKMYSESRTHFETCIKNKYQPAASYNHIAQTWLAEGDSAKYESVLKEGYEQYPDNEQLVIELIKNFMGKGDVEEGEKFLDLAIKKNEKNPSLYAVKAGIYDEIDEKAFNNYREKKKEYIEYGKRLFRERKKGSAHLAKLKKEQAAVKVEADKYRQESFDAFGQAEALYKKSVEVDEKFFNGLFNTARLHYVMFERYRIEADDVKPSDDAGGKLTAPILAKGKEHMKTAVKYFEKAHELDPKDRPTLVNLRNGYRKLGDKEKSKFYGDKIKAL